MGAGDIGQAAGPENHAMPSSGVGSEHEPRQRAQHSKRPSWRTLLVLLLTSLAGICAPAAAQSFGTCDARMFMDQVPTSTSTLFNVNYATAPFTLTSLGSSTSTTGRNGVGYNMVDNYIYGIRWPTGASVVELIRVSSNGAGQNLGVISGLPTSTYNNGVISPAGIYYLKSGLSNTTLYRVDLTAPPPYVATTITLSQPVQSFDFAWHNGLLYGVNSPSSPSQLISIDPATGTVTTIGSSFPLSTALAMWGYNNMILGSSGGAIYGLDPVTGSATLLSNISPSANNGDGANCPGANIQFTGDLSVTKTNTPASGASDLPSDSYTPGETRTYSIVVTNHSSSFGAQNVTVSDPVPAGIDPATVSWTCTNTSGSSRCGAANGTGALNDTGLDLPPGAVATYLLTMAVPAGFTGNLSNTVTITPPSTLNDTNTANNTATDVDQRTTRLTIVKSVPAGQGTAFDFSQAGMPASATGSPNASTVAAFTLNPSVVAGSNLTATQTYTNVTPGTAITVNELKSSNIGQYSLVNIVCTNAAGTASGSTFPTTINNAAPNGSPVGTATITLVSGADVTCTFNNVRNPRIVIVKNTVGGDGTFSFTETSSAAGTSLSPASPISLTTSGGSATVNTTISGLGGGATTNVTITEAISTGFVLSSVDCTNLMTGTALNTGTTPSATVTLASREVVLGGVATGSEVQCTFVNTQQRSDIQVVKTASPMSVNSGGVASYQILVSNNGPQAASNVVLSDVAGAGQNCSSPSTTATCSATGGASCPSPTVSVSSLLGAGITIPSLPVGGQVTVALQCLVTATGTP